MTGTSGRQVRSPFFYVAVAVAIAMSVFQLYTGGTITPIYYAYYPTHLGFALAVVFVGVMDEDWRLPPGVRRTLLLLWDALMLACSVVPSAYLVVNATYVMNRMLWFDEMTVWEVVFAAALTIAVIEASRRTVGIVLVIVAVLFIAYTFVGPWMPDLLWHRGVSVDRILEQIYMSPEGLYNLPVKVAADFVFLFVFLGALLLASGAGNFFTDIARAVTGRAVAGPAKTAVIASALMGMLQGSSNGNVATTGPFTIPAMRRYGYSSEYAAGVEAVASTGGQITPPIMGAAAFLMSEMAGIPYVSIMVMAIVPAFLYFWAVYVMVHLEARRLDLKGTVDEDAPPVLSLFLKQGYLLIPVVVMVWLLVDGYSPTMSGFWAIVTLAVLIPIVDASNRRRYFSVLYEAMTEAPKMMAPVTIACAVGGIIAGVIVRTGINVKLGTIVLEYSGGESLIALFLTMVVAVIIGMGVPTSAAYVVLAALLGPGLVKLGVPLAAGHLFIIYCASKSAITPPVAVASYTAAAIAGSDPWKTSVIAFRLGLSVFIIPYMFVYGPPLLSEGSLGVIAWSTFTAAFGVFALSVASAGWLKVDLKVHERLLAFVASLPMIYSGWRTDVLGMGLFAVLLAMIYLRARRGAPAKAAVSPSATPYGER
ncbi:MAG: TRAP transporter fused permease subunit [Proteobacteria bacterium]|nr:TRAP transporter fused permease subunit [Pseudomonadota bacterium]